MNRLLSLIGGLMILAIITTFPCFAQEDSIPSLAPENPRFTDFIQNQLSLYQVQTASEIAPGLIPEPFELPQPIMEGLMQVSAALPAFYDLRAIGKLTPVRNQGSCGSCWAFAAVGSLESFIMPAKSWDFSENNLKNLAGFDISCCDGGNRTMAASYFARWAGALIESDDPYNQSSCSSPSGKVPQMHIQDIIYLPNRASALDNDAIKNAVMNYGAVYTTYYHTDSAYKAATGGYYYSGNMSPNHAVCVVGWDDTFSRYNFSVTPPGDGAFIIRNSWGPYWGQNGYFYMSYYDALMGRMENAVFEAEPGNNYGAIYQYDTLGWTSNSGYASSTAWLANIFTATSNSSIAAASWYAGVPNSTYELYVYTNVTSGPRTGTLSGSKTGMIDTAGYHTIKLGSLVPITAGQKFSVVVKITTPGYSYPIPLERPFSGYSNSATAQAGQSYISSNGTSWTDVATQYSNTNVCLKAFTSGSSTPPTPTPGSLSVTPAGGLISSGQVGGPFSASSQVYTLTNTGESSINYTVGKTQSWVTLSSSSGILAGGASTTVTVMLNSIVNSLAAGTYSDTATFTNTTNNNGNTTRSVSLTVNGVTPPDPGVLSVSPATGFSTSGSVGGPFNPSAQVYTVTNTGNSSLNWTVTKTQSWVGITSSGGTLASGASATVTVSINSTANSLASGSYSDTISFINTTTGNGNTSRPVSLSVSGGITPTASYRIDPISFGWIDPSAHSKIYLGDNSAYGMSMPFAFGFYGKQYKTIYIGSNGLISFGSTGSTAYSNTNIPSVYTPNAAIYPYWDDLNPSIIGGAVRVGMRGTAPNRKFVISWVNVAYRSSTTTKFTFQTILSESTNEIVFQYLNVSPTIITYGSGRSATIGIENENGTQASRYSYNSASVINNSAIKFTPQSITGRLQRLR